MAERKVKTITLPCYNRPAYLAQTLASIRAARGHSEWTLIFSIDPGNPEVRSIARSTTWMPARVFRNDLKLGIDANTFHAAELAFHLGSDYNLYLEDDVVISPDALILASQFQSIAEAPAPAFLVLRRWHTTQDHSKPDVVAHTPAQGLFGNGFAYSMCHYRQHIRSWWFHYTTALACHGWDWSLQYGWETTGVAQYRPCVNRSQNIGVTGTNQSNGVDPNHYSPCYQGCVESFQFIPRSL